MAQGENICDVSMVSLVARWPVFWAVRAYLICGFAHGRRTLLASPLLCNGEVFEITQGVMPVRHQPTFGENGQVFSRFDDFSRWNSCPDTDLIVKLFVVYTDC